VVFDTFATCFVGGEENSAKEVGEFIAAIKEFQRDVGGAAVLIVHHTGRSEQTERGSSALRAAADTMLKLVREDGQATLICDKQKDSKKARTPRHKRIRAVVSGTAERPRLAVYRSLKNIYCQLIDDVAGVTLASASSLAKDFGVYGGNVTAAKKIGLAIAKAASEKGITEVVFDRGGNLYHGRVKAVAEGAREGGLKF
jgi:large subunit ribosomal protein L18